VSLLPVCLFPRDAVLRRKARRIPGIDRPLRRLVDNMIETMDYSRGVGLAAPQVGVSLRIIVLRLPGGEPIVLINPEIRDAAGEQQVTEGCLSIPGYLGELVRPAEVTVKGKDIQGKTVKIKAEGLMAEAFHHEIDHLDGILYLDHVTSPENVRSVRPEGTIL
jgi:peptide deformylase